MRTFSLGPRYQIMELLARGGMAEVYLTRHGELSGFQTPVVVKRILPHLACDEQFVSMFLDEAQIASNLNHPNVIRIFEVGHSGDEFFIAMELVQGVSLSQILTTKSIENLTEGLITFIGSQVAAGLHHAHTLRDMDGTPRNVVHRDISPQNILLGFDGAVKVIDFGVARAMGRISSTQQGGLKGKTGYMSPEQVRGDDVDHRTDVFALGVVLWEATARKRLFRAENELASINAILNCQVPELGSVSPSTSPRFAQIVGRSLQKHAADRYGTAAAMHNDLDSLAREHGGVTATDLARFLEGEFPEIREQWRIRMRRATAAPGSVTRTRGALSVVKTGESDAVSGSGLSIARSGSHTLYTKVPSGKRMILVLLGIAAMAIVAGVLVMRRNEPVAAPTPSPTTAQATPSPPARAAVQVPPPLPTPLPAAVVPPPAPGAVDPVAGRERDHKKSSHGSHHTARDNGGAVPTDRPPAAKAGPIARKPNPFD